MAHDGQQGNRPLALKLVPIPARGHSPLLGDLRNEFTTLSLLKHRNLAEVVDFGSTGKEMYFTSAWVDGKNLAEAADGADFNSIFEILVQTLRALDFIHKRGVLHLDLKPANILVTDPAKTGEMRVRVIDFGIAQWKRRGRVHESPVFGTPPFAAPEVILEKEPSPASDVYSLGMILHLIFAKRFPFPVQEPRGILALQTFRDPDYLSVIHPALPENFSALLHAMVAREASARPQSAAEILERLNACLGESFSLRSPAAPVRILGESDVDFHPAALEALIRRLAEREPKTIALAGTSGSGLTRTLLRIKSELQLRGIPSHYSPHPDLLAHADIGKTPDSHLILMDAADGFLAAPAKNILKNNRNRPLLLAWKGNAADISPWVDEVIALPLLNEAALSLFLEKEIKNLPAGLVPRILASLPSPTPAALEVSLQGLRESGRLLWHREGWLWQGDGLPDLTALGNEQAERLELRKRVIREILEKSGISFPGPALEGLLGVEPGYLEDSWESWCRESWIFSYWENGVRYFRAAPPEGSADLFSPVAGDPEWLADHAQRLYEEGKYAQGVALADILEKEAGREADTRLALHLARHLVAEGRAERALARLPAQAALDGPEAALALEIRARSLHGLGRLQEAWTSLEAGEAAYLGVQDAAGRARILNLKGTLRKAEAKTEEAEGFFLAAFRTAREAGDDYLAGSAQTNLALAYQERGKINEALAAYHEAWESSRRASRPRLTNVIFHNWINLLHHMGRSAEAEKSCYEWLNLAIRNGYPEQEASALNYLALFAGQKSLHDMQAAFLDQAIALLKGGSFSRLYAQISANRALLHWSRKLYPAAQRDAEAALALCTERPDDPLLAWIYLVLGKISRDRPVPDFAEADRCFAASGEIVRKNKTRQLLWEVEFNRGRLRKLTGDKDEARRHFQAADAALRDLEKDLPAAFKESYLRDRKSDRVRWELENLESIQEAPELPETLRFPAVFS